MQQGERFNSISHLVGTVLAAAGSAVLITSTALQGDPWKIVSAAVYGSSLVLLYLSSTLYHSLSGRTKRFFQKLDHSAIYLLIAGSYTPFTLVTLRGTWGWSLFGTVWALAVLGILIELFATGKRMRIIPVFIYLLMGWIVVFALRPLLRVLPLSGFLWLLAGGISYTLGVVFYVLDKRLPHSHGIFHLFVLGGSIAQFIAIYRYVL